MFLRRTTPNIKIEVEQASHANSTGLKINDEWRVTGDVIEVPRGSDVKIYYNQGGSGDVETHIMLNGFRVASGGTSAQYQFSAMESFKIYCRGVSNSGTGYSFVRMTTQ